MNYEFSASSAHPRLLILLTDELEESVKLVNHIIDSIIERNYNGSYPKNRFFITVIGYNKETNVLLSGYLREIDENPLSIKSEMVKIPDGAGGVVQVERKRLIWIEPQKSNPNIENYPKVICLAKELSQKWLADNKILAPIVIDISNEAHVENAETEIIQLKDVTSKDGQILFFGTYLTENKDIKDIFSKMPEVWKYKFERCGLDERDYLSGMLDRNKIFVMLSAITDFGGEVAFDGFNE